MKLGETGDVQTVKWRSTRRGDGKRRCPTDVASNEVSQPKKKKSNNNALARKNNLFVSSLQEVISRKLIQHML